MTIYAIGDIHGQRAMLEDALSLIEADAPGTRDEVIFLGDLVDRGPDSRGVIELIANGMAEGRNWSCVMGNHDRLFLDTLGSGRGGEDSLSPDARWLNSPLGSEQTLLSYGIAPATGRPDAEVVEELRGAVPGSHLAFLSARPLWLERDGLLFVHAGIRPGVPLRRQTEDDLLWIREEFLDHPGPHPWLVVHGHTPVQRPAHMGNRVALDTGAGFGHALTVAAFEGTECWVLSPSGRQALPPPAGRA